MKEEVKGLATALRYESNGSEAKGTLWRWWDRDITGVKRDPLGQ
jgi:hypothetical protein